MGRPGYNYFDRTLESWSDPDPGILADPNLVFKKFGSGSGFRRKGIVTRHVFNRDPDPRILDRSGSGYFGKLLIWVRKRSFMNPGILVRSGSGFYSQIRNRKSEF